MDITDRAALANHPKLGASWEGMALEQLIRASGASDEQVFFWGVHSQAELDLLILVIPGAADYPLEDRIHVRGLDTLIGDAPGKLIEP